MLTDFFTIAVLQLSILFGSSLPEAKSQTGSGFQVRQPYVHAPELYSEKLDFVATLVNLPGVKHKQSRWELSYQLFFIPEAKYQEALDRLPRGGSNPPPEHFRGRILLAQGHKKMGRLGTMEERTITLNGVPFKQKVPDALRTRHGVLMTGYSIKIFDAELKTNIYMSGIFLTDPFDDVPNDQTQLTPRKTLYLNFSVNPNGTLNYSQMPRRSQDATRR